MTASTWSALLANLHFMSIYNPVHNAFLNKLDQNLAERENMMIKSNNIVVWKNFVVYNMTTQLFAYSYYPQPWLYQK